MPGTAARTLARGAPDYPEGLCALTDPPARLHVQGGTLPPLARAVAIVGTRAATSYGRRIASRLAGDLAARGFVVVSGLAHGIDAAAHVGALEAGGATVAILPGALDRITPVDHTALAARIAGSGALVSEVAEGGPFGRGAFVRRNRLVAALAAATVVVEAGERSGARHTAAVACALGRALLAVPGDVDRPGSRGTLALLREGALPCADVADVLAAVGPAARAADTPESRLEACLGDVPRELGALAAACDAGPAETLARLLRLEWCGLARPHPGGRWSRGPR